MMFRHMRQVFICGLILVLLAAACTPAAPAPAQDDRLGNLEGKVDTLMQMQLDLTSLRYKVNQMSGDQASTAALQTRLDDLQSRLDKLTAEIETIRAPITNTGGKQAVNAFDIALAQYVLDSAGFHTMAAKLDETKTVDPAYLESVNRVQKVLSNTQFPPELTEQSQSFTVLLHDLAEALATEKGDQAAEVAKKVHSAQHGFTKAIDAWIKSSAGNSQ